MLSNTNRLSIRAGCAASQYFAQEEVQFKSLLSVMKQENGSKGLIGCFPVKKEGRKAGQKLREG